MRYNTMNTIWSKYIQGEKTLYYSRKLRFDDKFASEYKELFGLDETKQLKILEIGCGSGALTGSLARWYPNAEIIAIDRDGEFIRFAKEHEKGATFIEADIAALPFANESFDVVISNTVCEHIEHSVFYKEQLRILKPNGVCLVLSSRKGITVAPDCYAQSGYEKEFWQKAEQFDNAVEKYGIGKYYLNEAKLPAVMERYGFKNVKTGYVIANLTPDNPDTAPEFARAIINADRYAAIESIESVEYSMPEHFSSKEIAEMKRIVNNKYDTRINQYDNNEKQWDTTVSVTMVLRGIKPNVSEICKTASKVI